MVSLSYPLKDSKEFGQKALQWAAGFDYACCFDSNEYKDDYSIFSKFIAAGAVATFESNSINTFDRLQQFIDLHQQSWIPGFISYDLKNEIENLSSQHPNRIDFPDSFFFVPEHTILIQQDQVTISSSFPDEIFAHISSLKLQDDNIRFEGSIQTRMSRSEYIQAFDSLQRHIQEGDIYEVNLCQEFYAERAEIQPLAAYIKLNEVSPTPFSCFYKFRANYIISASPERFLSKHGVYLISQPIKGTAPRKQDPKEDALSKNTLRTNPKEISENIMIVDLVRNDLTKSAKRGSVNVDRLLEIQSFRQVHQLVSTIRCEIDESITAVQAIENTFPPGSMTGAPKISAMELIDRYENSRRGIYSGSIGYFSPDGNFDFNVVIRTLLYNADTGYLSFHTGGALTAHAEADKEYEECLLKGKAIFEILSTT